MCDSVLATSQRDGARHASSWGTGPPGPLPDQQVLRSLSTWPESNSSCGCCCSPSVSPVVQNYATDFFFRLHLLWCRGFPTLHFSSSLWRRCGDVHSCLWLVNVAHALDAVLKLDLCGVLGSYELSWPRCLIFPSGGEISMFTGVDGSNPQWLAPLGGSLSELLEREKVVCRGEAWSEAC